MSSTIYVVPKEVTWKLPEGRYPFVITSFKTKPVETTRGTKHNATILFEVTVPRMENYECMARKVLPMDLRAGSALRRFLEGLLGPDYFKGKSNQPIDLEKLLVGQVGEAVLVHAKYDEEKYSFPLVDVDALYPRAPEPEKPAQEGGAAQ